MHASICMTYIHISFNHYASYDNLRYAHPEDVVHGNGYSEAGVVRCLHDDGVRNEVWSKHQTESDEGTRLLGLTS